MWTPTQAPPPLPPHALVALGPYAFALHAGGVVRFDARTGRWDADERDLGDPISVAAARGRIYAATATALWDVDPDTLFARRLPRQRVEPGEVLCGGASGLWVVGRVLRHWDGASWRVLGDVPRPRRRPTAFERAGALWICGSSRLADVRLPDVEAGLTGGAGNVLLGDSGRWEEVALGPPGTALLAVLPLHEGLFVLGRRERGEATTALGSWRVIRGAVVSPVNLAFPYAPRLLLPTADGVLALDDAIAQRWRRDADRWEPAPLPTCAEATAVALTDGRLLLTEFGLGRAWIAH